MRAGALELRAPAMALLAEAEQLANIPAAANAAIGIRMAALQLIQLADDLHDAASTDLHPILADEPVAIAPLLATAIEGLDVLLGPMRRHIRTTPPIASLVLLADRRALSHIIQRVLFNATRLTQAGGWIDVTIETRPGWLDLVIQDEGSLLPGAGIGTGGADDRRGLSLGLAMSRRLMEAHGGSLCLTSAERAGNRVALAFPATRRIDTAAA